MAAVQGAGVAPAGETRRTLATQAVFSRRIAALAVDVVAVSLIQLAVNAVFGVTYVTGGSPVPVSGSVAMYTSTTTVGDLWLLAVSIAYFATLEALFGATLGKRLLGLRVTDLAGRRPSVWAVLARNLLRPLDAFPIVYGVGLCSALMSDHRQRLGDRLAGTIVVPVSVVGRGLSRRARERRAVILAAAVLALIAFCGAFFYFGRPPLVVQSMANMYDAPSDAGARWYILSAPRWGDGTVSYDVRFAPMRGGAPECTVTLTLRWGGLYGWQPGTSVVNCATP